MIEPAFKTHDTLRNATTNIIRRQLEQLRPLFGNGTCGIRNTPTLSRSRGASGTTFAESNGMLTKQHSFIVLQVA